MIVLFTELCGCLCTSLLTGAKLGECEQAILYRQPCSENAMLVNKEKG